MHELSIAQNIVSSIHEHVGIERIPYVTKITMQIGAACGVVSDSLHYAFDAIVQDTPLKKALLETEIVPFKVHCKECGKDSENESGYRTCSICNSPDVSIVSGTDMILKQIELIDE